MADVVIMLRTLNAIAPAAVLLDAAAEIERLRAQLAPPEPLPGDVEALAHRLTVISIDAFQAKLDASIAMARLVLADRQRAVEASYATGVEDMRQTIIAENEEEAIGGGPLCVESGYWGNAKRYLLNVRARGAAQEE